MKGFTLIEILVVLGIITLLSIAGITTLPQFKKNVDIDVFSNDVVSLLVLAQAQTLSSYNDNQYSVRLEQGRVVLFTGATFSESDPENTEISAPSTVEMVSITLTGGGSDVTFKKFSGETDQYGTATVRLKSDPAKTRTITIEPTGVVGSD